MNSPPFPPNRIHQALLLRGEDSAIGRLRHSNYKNAPALERVARTIAFDPSVSSRVHFTTGIGLSRTEEIPVRLPTLLLPVLKVLERCKEIGLDVPRYSVYQATEFIAEANGIAPEQAHRVSGQMEQYLRRYVETLHPDIAHAVNFHFGCTYPADVRVSVERIADDIREYASSVLDQLERCETRHSNRNGEALHYAAANVLYSGADYDSYPFQNGDGTPEVIIPVGGDAEKPFFQMTSEYAGRNSNVPVMPLLTQLGSRPTYYPYAERGDPLTIDQYAEAVESGVRDGPLRRDIQALLSDGAQPEVLKRVFPSPVPS